MIGEGQLPSWNRRGGAKRRGGSQIEKLQKETFRLYCLQFIHTFYDRAYAHFESGAFFETSIA